MPTSTTARSTCRRPDSMAGELPRHHLGAERSLHYILVPKDSDTGSRKDAYLLLEKDMEGHEREEAEVSRHGNVTVILHTETSQKSSHGPLCGDGPAPAIHSSTWAHPALHNSTAPPFWGDGPTQPSIVPQFPALERWARPGPPYFHSSQLWGDGPTPAPSTLNFSSWW